MGFIGSYFGEKKEIHPHDIEFFKSQKIEENINLDYKDIRAYDDPDELAKDVSSFANSEGGLIFLGMSQDEIKQNGKIVKIYPKEVTWGKASLDKESLENRLLSKIRPPVNNLIIRPVRNEKDQVVFLIDIPRSELAPHMAPDHKYHTRTNFGTRILEHHEVANLFRINWTMKEKLVEKIYEPLSSVLEKHIKELKEYSYPSNGSITVEEILSRTYYKVQMPFELLEKIHYYDDQLKDLWKKSHLARRSTFMIVNRILAKLLKEIKVIQGEEAKTFADFPLSYEDLQFDFKPFSARAGGKSSFTYNQYDIYRIVMKNQKMQMYLKETFPLYDFNRITIQPKAKDAHALYGIKPITMKIEEFDEKIWKTFLKEASKNTDITQMRTKAKTLHEEAWDLIETIMRY